MMMSTYTSTSTRPSRKRSVGTVTATNTAFRNNNNYRRSRSTPTVTRIPLTKWIGCVLICLVLCYLTAVVTLLTGTHLDPDKKKLSEQVGGTRSGGSNTNPVPSSLYRSHQSSEYILTAFIEKVDFDTWMKVTPLPNRSHEEGSTATGTFTADATKLRVLQYPKVNSCSKLVSQWPVDMEDTPPAEQDPFLPWIHDVFPTADGKYIQIIAQNRKRCRTGPDDTEILAFMEPQLSNFQHISVQRITSKTTTKTTPRYRLCTHAEADPDGIATRFICRFKNNGQQQGPSSSSSSSSSSSNNREEETLSEFNFDYDWTNHRKRYVNGFTEGDGGIKSIHTSQLLFRCPVPSQFQTTVREGTSVENDYATLFLDLIPIRTPPRFGNPAQYFQPKYKEEESHDPFDPIMAYGTNHILPRIEDSGRIENIPICKPSLMTYEENESTTTTTITTTNGDDNKVVVVTPQKKHNLVSCIWASAGYATRGERFTINDGQRRLLEWITHNKLIGFDHFYLYDNSGAFNNCSDSNSNSNSGINNKSASSASLKNIADLFPEDVTYIPWPSKVCNNRPNNVKSPGERSSQYAAEASCRLRFGPHVNWIGQFDIDEYLIPMGNHTTILPVLDQLDKEDKKIVSFGSWRAWPRLQYIEQPTNTEQNRFDLKIPQNTTILQAYNCDRQPPGQKNSQMPAEKQLYRPEYVLQHFVHYSAATVLSEMNKTEYKKQGFGWKGRAFPDARQRFINELTEGLMIHTKAVASQDTDGWYHTCRVNPEKMWKNKLCRLGIPWPNNLNYKQRQKNPATDDGWLRNCWVNEKVDNYLVPRLEDHLTIKQRLLAT